MKSSATAERALSLSCYLVPPPLSRADHLSGKTLGRCCLEILSLKYPDTARIPSQKGGGRLDDDRRGERRPANTANDCPVDRRVPGSTCHAIASGHPYWKAEVWPFPSPNRLATPYTYTWFDSGAPCTSGPQASGAPRVLVNITSPGTVHSLSIWQKSASELTIEMTSGEGIEPSGGGFIIIHAMTEIVAPRTLGQIASMVCIYLEN
jgi:hypothetical protein